MGISIPGIMNGGGGQQSSMASDYPESPRMVSIYVSLSRPGYPDQPFAITPLRMEYVESVKAMSALTLTIADPDFTFIDNDDADIRSFFTEDLQTDLTVRFGYPDGANMSEPIKMVFYKQQPVFPESGPVETTLVAYDEMIFFTLPFEQSLMESPQGVTVGELVSSIVTEVNAMYGRKIKIDFGGHNFEGEWYRFHKVAKEVPGSPGIHKAVTSKHGSHVRAGNPLEFMYGMAQMTRSTSTDSPIEIFAQGGKLFFRPCMPNGREITAHYTYGSSNPYERLLSFEPEVQLKPSMSKFRTVDPETGDTDEASADNATDLNRPNLTPQSNGVFNVGVQGGSTAWVRAGSRKGDYKGKQSQTGSTEKLYKIKSGDTLDGIAQRLGIQADVLIKLNNLTPDGSTDRTKIVNLKPGNMLKYPVAAPKPSDTKAEPNNAASTTKVQTNEQRAQANRAFLVDEYKGVKAHARVLGHPKLKAGWPIYIDNVGDNWSGPWYVEEVTHTIDEGGYFCTLDLSRDGFMIGAEQDENSGYKANDDFEYDSDVKTADVRTAAKANSFNVNVQGGGTATGPAPSSF